MRKLKILQITNRLPWPLNDGGNIATLNVTRYLHELGHQVTLASLNTNKHFQDPAVLPNYATIHAVPIQTDVTALGAIKGLFTEMPYNVSRFESEAFRTLLQQLCKEHEFDIIQLEGSYQAIYLDTLRANSTAKIVLRSHNVEYKIWSRLADAESNPLKRWYLNTLSPKIRAFEERTMAGFDGIVAIADQDEAFYRAKGYSGALTCINAGAVHGVAAENPASPPQTIAFLGSLEWEPNVQGLHWFLDNIWKTVQPNFPEAQLHVGGKNPPASLFDLQVAGMTFHGEVPDAEAFVQSSGIFVVPLLSGGGMRLKIVEAMARGRCVISTSIGAEGIAGVHGSELFIADSPADFSQILSELLADPERVLQVGAAARTLAIEKYKWSKLVKDFESFYFSLL